MGVWGKFISPMLNLASTRHNQRMLFLTKAQLGWRCHHRLGVVRHHIIPPARPRRRHGGGGVRVDDVVAGDPQAMVAAPAKLSFGKKKHALIVAG